VAMRSYAAANNVRGAARRSDRLYYPHYTAETQHRKLCPYLTISAWMLAAERSGDGGRVHVREVEGQSINMILAEICDSR
jgi:hypothetical protein